MRLDDFNDKANLFDDGLLDLFILCMVKGYDTGQECKATWCMLPSCRQESSREKRAPRFGKV
jgi:hypothetical protein